jgi:hypothetical protein
MTKNIRYTEYEIESIGSNGPIDRFTTRRMNRARSIADRLQREGHFVTITRCLFRRLKSEFVKKKQFDFYYLSDDRKLRRLP